MIRVPQMKATVEQLESAKSAALRRLRSKSWLRGIGIGKVADAPGIVFTVAPDGEKAIEAVLAKLHLDVPTRVQVLGPIRKRPHS